jgi:hypothetical protein
LSVDEPGAYAPDDRTHDVDRDGEPAMGESTDRVTTTPLRAEMISAAEKYLDAIVTHDPSDVPLADHAWRIEQGRRDASSADEIRAALQSEVMDVVVGRRPARWVVDESAHQAVAFYEVDLAGGGTCRLGERFLVRDGLIEEIEAVFIIDE